MSKNRFLSFISAVAVMFSSLPVLTAATAYAKAPEYTEWTFNEAEYGEDLTATPTSKSASDPTDGLSYWTLPEASYTEDFTEWVDNSTGLPAYNGSWSLYNGDRNNNTYLMVRKNSAGEPVLAMAWHGRATYTTAPETGVYYYTYTINMWNKTNANNVVYLDGLNYGIIVESPLANTAENTFTTVVDADNSKAYTYDENGTLLGITTISESEKVTGIVFECLDGNSAIWVKKFAYGVIVEGDAPSEVPTASPSPSPTPKPEGYPHNISYWTLAEPEYTQTFTLSSTDDLDVFWTLGNTSGGTVNPKHITVSENERIELKWYGSAAYNGVPENGSYYYRYTVRMNDKSGDNRISLEGLTDGIVLNSVADGSGDGPYYTFTTVVDIYSAKAYTYNEAGDLVNETAIPKKESVTGIKFGAYNNTTSSMLVESFEYGPINIDIAAPYTIKVKSDAVNGGKVLSKDKTYAVKAEKFEASEFMFDEPVAVLADGTAPIYLSSTMEITGMTSGIKADGRNVSISADLLSGEYPLTITVKAECNGRILLTEVYSVTVVKDDISPDDIINDYIPAVRSEGKNLANNDTVTEDIILPSSSGIMTIEWSSSNAAVIAADGSLTRPIYDTEVTLTAKITAKADTSKSKEYKITVKVLGAGEMLRDAIAEAKAALVSADSADKVMTSEKLSDLHEDIKLYTEYKNTEYIGHDNVAISYTSDNPALKIADGIAGIYPTEVKIYNATLNIKATIGATELTEGIPVTVNLTPDNAADKYAVRCDDIAPANFAVLEAVKGTTASSDITVPTKGIFGSTISWTSSVPMYLSNTGKYTAPSNTTAATLTGIISHGKIISGTSHAYTFNLRGKNNSTAPGGGGGSAPARSDKFTVPAAVGTQAPTAPSPQPDNTEQAKGFSDLGTVIWAVEAINALADKGIVSGKKDSIFAPNDNITRAEFAKLIVNAFGFADDKATTDAFADVADDEWYAPFIAAAYNNGIINGYENGAFGVNDKITRQDMAVILYRAAEAAGISIEGEDDRIIFDDAEEIADYAKTAVTALYKNGVINGISDTEFAPLANATRAQAAKMVYELIK